MPKTPIIKTAGVVSVEEKGIGISHFTFATTDERKGVLAALRWARNRIDLAVQAAEEDEPESKIILPPPPPGMQRA